MRFYNQQHRHYCGIDLHARTMYVCKALTILSIKLARAVYFMLRRRAPFDADRFGRS